MLLLRLRFRRRVLQGAGRQIGVLVFELAVEGEPPFIFVVGQKGCQGEHLAQRETRSHRASLPDIEQPA